MQNKDAWLSSLPSAPIFYPTTDEFKDPIAYIQKISATAKSAGICKVVPPKEWNPKFALNLETIKFPTRIQNIANLQKKKMSSKNARRTNLTRPLSKNVDQVVCEVCEGGFHEEVLLLCDKCGKGYHIYCLTPPLSSIPEGDWICIQCRQKNNEIGFEEGKVYSFPLFEKIGNRFKECYFEGKDVKNVTISEVETHFWRIVEHREREVEVLYGNDLDTSVYGTGFPSDPSSSEIAESPWNLNNIARVPGSMLACLKDNILGVIVPWMYFGMMFSAFCWHNEDHHMYSIAYHHFGAPKTWYGVAGSYAPLFESVMKSIMPSVFETYPDLLYQLAVMISPRILIQKGIPVHRAHQMPGEFIVTFPAAFHAGFSHGINCTEAVNFASADWLPNGYEAVQRYRLFRREPVFSHEQLVLESLNTKLEPELYKLLLTELERILERERQFYEKSQICCGVTNRYKSEMVVLDNHHCKICNTQLYISAVTCKCSRGKGVCLEHTSQLCTCDKKHRSLVYRFQIQELETLLKSSTEFLSSLINQKQQQQEQQQQQQPNTTTSIPETPPRCCAHTNKKIKIEDETSAPQIKSELLSDPHAPPLGNLFLELDEEMLEILQAKRKIPAKQPTNNVITV